MSTPWLRLWSDMPNDPKWRTIARASKQSIPSVLAVYVHILVIASNADERGRTQNMCSEDIASALDLDTEQVDAILSAMQGRVLDGDMVAGWSKRQPIREDGSAERGKARREAIKQKNEPKTNADERTQPKSNANKRPEIEVEVDTEIEVEEKTSAVVILEDNAPEPDLRVSRQGAICMVIKAEGIGSVNPQHPELLALIDQGADVGHFASAAKTAREKGKGFAYLLGIVKGQIVDAKGIAGREGVAAKAPLQAESFKERDDRIARGRWEEMTGRTHPDNLAALKHGGDVIDITPKTLEISQ